MAEDTAGAGSIHLDRDEQVQAAEHAAPQALVIHEVVREEGELELRRRNVAFVWSGLAAGLSMGFSLLTLAILQSRLPTEPWRQLLDSFGYCVGFVIAILGRQQLFTESTLTAMLPLMVRRDGATLVSVLRLWGIVLGANLIGTIVFAALISPEQLFDDNIHKALVLTAQGIFSDPVEYSFVKAILAGWLIALMVWLLPSARSARLFVILLLTYVVAVGRLPHVIAGSVEASFAVVKGYASAQQYLLHFLVPTLIGNTIGGVALVAFLNHAPLAPESQHDVEENDGLDHQPKAQQIRRSRGQQIMPPAKHKFKRSS
jgi:formate-nitrite transporter family protein